MIEVLARMGYFHENPQVDAAPAVISSRLPNG